LTEHAAEARVLARRYAAGDPTARPDLVRKHAEMEEDFQALAAVDRDLGATLDTSRELGVLQEDWRFLHAKALEVKPADTVDLHTKLLHDLRALVSHVGDTSNLVLDSGLETHYLIDMALLKLPPAEEQLSDGRLLSAGLRRGAELTADERARFIVLTGLLDSNAAESRKSMDIAFRHDLDGAIRAQLEDPLRDYLAAVRAVGEMTHRGMLGGRTITADPAAYDAALGRALEAGFTLWDGNARALDRRLQAHINRTARWRDVVGLLAGLFVLLIIFFYLLLLFHATVMGAIARIAERWRYLR
jgi:hypothetical protein